MLAALQTINLHSRAGMLLFFFHQGCTRFIQTSTCNALQCTMQYQFAKGSVTIWKRYLPNTHAYRH
jgi:hypothetical protein